MEKYCFRCNKKTSQTLIEDKRTYFNTAYKRSENEGRIMFKCITLCDECSTETGRSVKEEPVKVWRDRTYHPKYNKARIITFNKNRVPISEQDLD